MTRARIIQIWQWTVRIAALGYPLALLIVWLGMRLGGERWWFTTVLLYLPRAGWALPLPFLTVALLFTLRRRWLLSQALALILVLFPLMGLRFSFSRAATKSAAPLRVVSLNTASDRFGAEGLTAQVAATRADLILLQEARTDDEVALRALLPEFNFSLRDQFLVASRYPIELRAEPALIDVRGVAHHPRFLSFDWVLPQGRIRVYSVHPVSPREGFENLRGRGLRDNVARGRFLEGGKVSDRVAANAELRVRSLEAVAADAAQASLPVLIAGDTNLPDQSWALARLFGHYQDGFVQVGRGFGYTFPATKRPWMRIDRVFADRHFRFLAFAVLGPRVSDHCGVVADLELAK